MFEIVRYTSDRAAEWNQFVAQSKNGTFLFDRDYMDYHSDRFQDCSLMFYQKGKLYALLSANKQADMLVSHQGLTYGGLLLSNYARTSDVYRLFLLLNNYLFENGFRHVVYKHIPWVYTRVPSEEDLYALTAVCHATLKTRHVASVVDLEHRLHFNELRTRGVRKAQRAAILIRELDDLAPFWQVLEENLYKRYGTRPVHSLSEMTLLKQRFPNQIRLFVACKADRVLGGTVLYYCGHVVKTQYISANEEGKQCGALDLLFDRLLSWCVGKDIRFFDFGTSNGTCDGGINEGLVFQKEGFEIGRASCRERV